MLVFVLACIAGYFVVRAAVTNTIEHQAVAIADIVASQATTARSVYASQIAEKLVISENTVKGHVSNILSKLHLADRTQVAVYAWQQGIVNRNNTTKD